MPGKTIIGSERAICPYCQGKNIFKKGRREKKLEIVQLWYCKDCKKVFTPQLVKGKTFPVRIILDGISYYNIGYSLEESCKFLKEQYGISVQPTTLSNWLGEYKDICKYSRMRKFGTKLFTPNQVIQAISLYHRQIYKFRIHQAKLALLLQEDIRHRKFEPLREFLEAVFAECPHHLFKEGSMRMSELGRRGAEAKPKFSGQVPPEVAKRQGQDLNGRRNVGNGTCTNTTLEQDFVSENRSALSGIWRFIKKRWKER